MSEKISLDTKYDLDGEYNPSDSEDEYSENEKRLLAKARRRNGDDSGSEEEVYGFSDSEKEEDEVADSDIEGQEASGDDLPDARAWGLKKKSFYSTDYVDEDYGGFGKDEEKAMLEEKEARILQTSLAKQLEDDDFSLEFFTSKKTGQEGKHEKDGEILIKTDLSQMSKRQKLQLLVKESPEFNGLVEDFKTKLSLARNILLPFLNLAKEGKIPNCKAIQFVQTKYDLLLNYCTNISFYLLLKTKKTNIQNHPAIKRLYQYRQMLNQLEPIFENSIKPQIESILSAVDRIENIETENSDDNELSEDADIDSNKQFEDIEPRSIEGGELTSPIENDQNVIDGEGGEKRAITYQMAKNKGLTPHRKKEQRNPRVKHRNKYRKAQIRRKGAIREVRTELTRYAGEASGIKANVKKSIKIR